MSNWDIKVGFSNAVSCTLQLDDNMSPKEIADLLISRGLIDGSDMDENIYLLPDKTTGGVSLVDDSGYPYATLFKKKEQTLGEVANMEDLPQCPTCGSTNLTKIGAMTRGIDRAFFGRHSPEAKAQFRCNKCGYLW